VSTFRGEFQPFLHFQAELPFEEDATMRLLLATCVAGFAFLSGFPSTGRADPIFFPGTGHYYDFVPGSFTWEEARIDAMTRIHLGTPGHLATLTSMEEDEFIRTMFSAQVDQPLGPWFGASWDGSGSGPTEGWSWVTGEDFAYTGWNAGEPNHLFLDGGLEDAIHFSNFVQGQLQPHGGWNDIFRGRNNTIGYFVEF
jgi:hypothetical protein